MRELSTYVYTMSFNGLQRIALDYNSSDEVNVDALITGEYKLH